jgi:hypothetical protein
LKDEGKIGSVTPTSEVKEKVMKDTAVGKDFTASRNMSSHSLTFSLCQGLSGIFSSSTSNSTEVLTIAKAPPD